MKVRELIEELQKFDPELEVIKQKDDEGNGFSPVYSVDDEGYALHNNYGKPDYYEIIGKEDAEHYYEHEGNRSTQVVVIV